MELGAVPWHDHPLKSPSHWTETCWYTNMFTSPWQLQEISFTVVNRYKTEEWEKTCSSLTWTDWLTFKGMSNRFLINRSLFRLVVTWDQRTLQRFFFICTSSNIKKLHQKNIYRRSRTLLDKLVLIRSRKQRHINFFRSSMNQGKFR